MGICTCGTGSQTAGQSSGCVGGWVHVPVVLPAREQDKAVGVWVGGWVHVPVVLAARQQDKAVGVWVGRYMYLWYCQPDSRTKQ